MRPQQILTSLILPVTAVSLPTSPASPHTSEPSPPAPRGAAQTCGLYKFAETPINPPACWAWYAQTSQPSDYCGASTFKSVASASSPSASWLDSCASLRNTQIISPRDFFLADYATDKFNTFLMSGDCSFQVQPATPPSSDQVYVGGTDIADILGSAIAASRNAGGSIGIEGSMTCSPGIVRWRMVPV
ncbi:uncharacterized protein F4817DRAFT_198244 [Daldinia loculata]|uniref:uncharacterized protein n=1 Tax=Daldinia loculata TaxID=103429 RepID=UPI0020C3A7EB|nr:uncharacterized protein F4817DRAFT_198244 [Daldinia loculata]KAI1644843.1 hypothetical protein F4817DRAFT_198244 [Daldinia loculata]